MAEFQSYYYEKGLKEIMNPHPLKPFKDDWASWGTKTTRFTELVYIGDEKNITLYFQPIDDKQVSFSDKNKQMSPVENPCYFSLSGESEFEKIFRAILLAYLEPLVYYKKAELSFAEILKAVILVEQVKQPEQDLGEFLRETCTRPLGFLKKFQVLEKPEFLEPSTIKLIEPATKWSGGNSKPAGQTELEKAKDRLQLLQEHLCVANLEELWNLILADKSLEVSFTELSVLSYGLAMGYELAYTELLGMAKAKKAK